jgi:hypothetical protein
MGSMVPDQLLITGCTKLIASQNIPNVSMLGPSSSVTLKIVGRHSLGRLLQFEIFGVGLSPDTQVCQAC